MAASIAQFVRDQIDRIWRDRQFNATVVSIEATNQLNVQRTGTDVTEGPYAAAEGVVAAVTAGDRVKVEWVSGAYQVAYKLGDQT